MNPVCVKAVVSLIIAALVVPVMALAGDVTKTDESGPYWPAARRDTSRTVANEARRPMWTVADDDEPSPQIHKKIHKKVHKTVRPAARHTPQPAAVAKAPAKAKQPARVVRKPAPLVAIARPPVLSKAQPPKAPAQKTPPTKAEAKPASPSANTTADKIILDDATKGCAAKDPNACLILGRMYVTGTAAPKDDAAAMKVFTRSCDLGSGAACHALSQMHERGKGTRANPAEAARYTQLACKRGYATACKTSKKAAAPTLGFLNLFASKPSS